MDIRFEDLAEADLNVGDVLKSIPPFNAGQDPIARALPRTRNVAGFRSTGPAYVVLTTNLDDTLWPDSFDRLRGTFTYYGDNRSSGSDLHDTPQGGNRCLRSIFDALAMGRRREIPPVLVFGPGDATRDFRFYGLFAPGPDDLTADLKSDGNSRFLNYQAKFTLLDCPCVSRTWITDLSGENRDNPGPEAWRDFIINGTYRRVASIWPADH